MSSNYPPGVTGNEPQIVGYPLCGFCGHEAEAHTEPDTDHACEEPGCECPEYSQYGDGE
jgi:hypothetical protein